MKYHLEKYHGRASRHKCPQCGDPHSFTHYVDEDNQPIDPICGKCDHVSSCGYHYPPRQYFQDHPTDKPLKKNYVPKMQTPPKPPKPLCTIPFKYVRLSASWNSTFGVLLWGLFDWRYTFDNDTYEAPILKRLMELYVVGATKDKDVIFWQIDINGKVRTGQIMRFKPDGHRDHNYTNWIHAKMKKKGLLPNDWELTQCLFGEHLLNLSMNREKVVAVVESAKSALIGAACFPKYVWLATCGKNNLSIEKMKVLKGRKVVLFPDVDGFKEWKEKAKEFTFCTVKVADVLEKNATDEERANKIDIADWLIMQIKSGRLSPKFPAEEYKWPNREKPKSDLELIIEEHPFIQGMIDELGLIESE